MPQAKSGISSVVSLDEPGDSFLPVWSVSPKALGTVEASKPTGVICRQFLFPPESLCIESLESRTYQLRLR